MDREISFVVCDVKRGRVVLHKKASRISKIPATSDVKRQLAIRIVFFAKGARVPLNNEIEHGQHLIYCNNSKRKSIAIERPTALSFSENQVQAATSLARDPFFIMLEQKFNDGGCWGGLLFTDSAASVDGSIKRRTTVFVLGE